MSSKEMLEHLADMKIPAKSASSTLEDAYVSIVRKKLKPILEARAAEIEAEKKAAAEKAAEEARIAAEQAEKDHKDLLDFAQETLKGYVSKVRISKILKSGTVCLTADGPVSLEMEKYFHKMRRDFPMSAEKVLELNPESPAFQALCKAYDEDKEKAKNYIQVLYYQALIIADLPLPDPAHYAELVCGLMQ